MHDGLQLSGRSRSQPRLAPSHAGRKGQYAIPSEMKVYIPVLAPSYTIQLDRIGTDMAYTTDTAEVLRSEDGRQWACGPTSLTDIAARTKGSQIV